MVMKLIKNGFRESFREFSKVLYSIAAVFVMLIVIRLTGQIPSGAIQVIILFLVFAIFALAISILILSLIAYAGLLYKSLYRQESYRIFTMPATSTQILISRIALSVIWGLIISVVTFVVAFATAWIITPSFTSTIPYMMEVVSYIFSQLGTSYFIVSLVQSGVDALFFAVMVLFVGSIVNSSYIQNRRVLWFFVIYFVLIYVVNQVFLQFDYSTVFINIDENYLNQIMSMNMVQGLDYKQLFQLYVDGEGVRTLMLVLGLKTLLCGFLGYGTVWFWDHKLEMID